MNPTFKLARQLNSKGHRVSYLVCPDARSLVPETFECIDFWDDVYPKGTVRRLAQLSGAELRATKEHLLSKARESVDGNYFETCLTRLNADLILADVFLFPSVLVAWKNSIPCISVSVILPPLRLSGFPPLQSRIVPRAGWLGRIQSEVAWYWHQRQRRRRIQSGLEDPGLVEREEGVRLAAGYGHPLERLHTETHFSSVVSSLVPMLVLCPKAFDFPKVTPDWIHYSDASVDRLRVEDEIPFDWNWLERDRKLVFCSLGSQPLRYPQTARLLHAFLQALSKRRELQGVVSVGWPLPKLEDDDVPDNVRLFPWVPQLALLERAAVFVSHGGLSSVKEAILSGTPLVIFPQMYDQAGNAARVRAHHLGLVGGRRDISAKGVGRLIDHALADTSFSIAIQQMRQRFLECEMGPEPMAMIEAMLLGARR